MKTKGVKAKVLLVKVPKKKIGLFTALVDGSGRNAIVRTKEGAQDLVYLIATPDTYENLLTVLENIGKHLEVQVWGLAEDLDVG